MNGNGPTNPLGTYAPFVAVLVSVMIVGAAVLIRLADAWSQLSGGRGGQGDPFLDNAALLVVGVVLGIAGIGGQSASAQREALAAHARLDQIGAPPAQPRAGNGNGK